MREKKRENRKKKGEAKTSRKRGKKIRGIKRWYESERPERRRHGEKRR